MDRKPGTQAEDGFELKSSINPPGRNTRLARPITASPACSPGYSSSSPSVSTAIIGSLIPLSTSIRPFPHTIPSDTSKRNPNSLPVPNPVHRRSLRILNSQPALRKPHRIVDMLIILLQQSLRVFHHTRPFPRDPRRVGVGFQLFEF
jgi:hypothetical protein